MPNHLTTDGRSQLSRNDRLALWWLLESSVWQLGDMLRFARHAQLLSLRDATELLKKVQMLETHIKKGREDAISA